MYNDILPEQANTTERFILITYHILGTTDPKEIAKIIGHKNPSEVYRCLKKYRDSMVEFTGSNQREASIKIFRRVE